MNSPQRYARLLIGLVLLLLAEPVWAQLPKPDKVLINSVSGFLRTFSEQIQATGNPADSTRWPARRQQLTGLFTTDTLTLPNTLVDAETYAETQPTIRVRDWAALLPGRFWQTFRVGLDERTAIVRPVKSVGLTVVEVEVAVGIRGIFADTRRAHRLTETWLLTLETQSTRPKPGDWRIRQVRAVDATARPAPITRRGAKAIRQTLQDALTAWLAPGPDSLRQPACAQLRTMLAGDTIFFQTTDKVLHPVAIKECRGPVSIAGADGARWQVVSFSLTYVTDVYRQPNRPILAERTRMEAVRPDAGTAVWYANRSQEVVQITDAEAAKGPSYWTVYQVVVHP